MVTRHGKSLQPTGCLIGFAPYHYEKHSLLNGLMQFDMKLLGEDYLKAAISREGPTWVQDET